MADLKANNGVLNGDAAHDLSEGYGFIYSLQFTRKYSREYVGKMLHLLTKDNGLWSVTNADLHNIHLLLTSVTLRKSHQNKSDAMKMAKDRILKASESKTKELDGKNMKLVNENTLKVKTEEELNLKFE